RCPLRARGRPDAVRARRPPQGRHRHPRGRLTQPSPFVPLEEHPMTKYTITVEPVGREVQCDEDQTILDACLRAGVWLPHSCTHGTCATCKVDKLDGEVDL